MAMDDGELESSNQEMFLGSNVGDILSSDSMNSFFDEIFNNAHVCTHTHKCNPPGPDSTHTHTCYHVHTKLVPSINNDEVTPTAESLKKTTKRKLEGNQEAVRKYREKKKAQTASLEDEVVRLRALNQQLMRRIQSQAGLEAEVGRLKCLLVDIRGRIDGEIGSFPYRKQQHPGGYQSVGDSSFSGWFLLNPCDECEPEDMQCLGNQGSMINELPECGTSNGTKRKAGARVTSK